MTPRPGSGQAGFRPGSRPSLRAAAALLLFPLLIGLAGAVDQLSATLLTRDLGDPRAPGNVKIVLSLPAALAGRAAAAKARDFQIYVYPAGLPEAEATAGDTYRAGGVYLWRSGGRVFLDARVVPVQDRDGPATVKVVYAPGGHPLAEGVAQGRTSYASELVDVVLAVDVSRSMNHNDPRKLRVAAARTFIEMARRGGGIGRVGLVTFNHRARLVAPLLPLARGEELLAALNGIGADGLTSLDAPLNMGIAQLSGARSQRPAVILLTDGRNEGTRYRDTHRKCADAGIRLFTVGLAQSADHELLKRMADETGGIYFRAPADSDLPEIYARLAAELGKRQLMHAEVLRSAAGNLRLPVDATVRRMVAMADGGARLGARGPRGMVSADGMSSAFVDGPEPGDWDFAWDRADANHSVAALFGDTQFYLDLFPPQLRGTHLALGATLAHGGRALPGARVWVEPKSGVLPERIELFDDGRHGDGEAGDGVYGAVVEVPPDSPDRFDLTVRADGQAWDRGAFVRQALGLAIKSRDPLPKEKAAIDGELDFGVLFPGEAGTALARMNLESQSPREIFFELDWDSGERAWPELFSSAVVQPGRRAFELEMLVPDDAAPGAYAGRFTISDGGYLTDAVTAKVTVGSVRFDNPGIIDLGEVPPGTFAVRSFAIGYDADKDADLDIGLDGDADVVVNLELERVAAGKGAIPMEAMVSIPIGKGAGEYRGQLRLRAGPGLAVVPLRWRVKAHSVPAASVTPPEGLPLAPELPDSRSFAPLVADGEGEKSGGGPDGWPLVGRGDPAFGIMGAPVTAGRDDDASTWERTHTAIRSRTGPDDAPLELPARTGGVRIPDISGPTARDGDSFWSAWWIYLLAALLLLLLLLLLLAYILYRLGKSALARWILVSSIANMILLIVFIALLSTAAAVPARAAPSVTVTLVEDDLYNDLVFTPSEESLFDASGVSEQARAGEGGGEPAAGELTFTRAAAAGGALVSERRAETAEPPREGLELAETALASAMPLERREPEHFRRRQRRSDRAVPTRPETELPEIAEPPIEAKRDGADQDTELAEARMEIEAPNPSERPVWSDGDRVTPPSGLEQSLLSVESPGMEAVALAETSRRVAPHGRRREPRERNDIYPEPRVEVADPVRDSAVIAAPGAQETGEDPGVEEVRASPPSMGRTEAAGKPGAPRLPGAITLVKDNLAELPRGPTGSDAPSAAAPLGGPRTVRGGAPRMGTALASPSGASPSGLRRETTTGGGRESPSRRSGSGVGEKRFDAAGSGGDSGEAVADAGGDGDKGPAVALSGGGASPNPFAGSSGMGRVAYPGGAEGGAGNGERAGPGGMRGDRRRGERLGTGDRDVPRSGGRVPGGSPGQPAMAGAGTGAGDAGSARGAEGTGVGEGRFDDAGRRTAAPGFATRRGGLGVREIGRAALMGDESAEGLDVVPLPVAGGELRRHDRRGKRRSVNVAASLVEMDSLLVVVGDFAGPPDAAADNLFADLSRRLARGLTVEERRLTPLDANLADCLLAILTPEEADNWSEAEIRAAGVYLARGGHIWLDESRPGLADAFMERLALAAGGGYGPLEPGHQLVDDAGGVDAIVIAGKVAAVATRMGWRDGWRHGSGDGGALRFLVRSLNYFLSGNAETGIDQDAGGVEAGLLVEGPDGHIPDRLSGAASESGSLWDDFGPDSAASWRMPGWSDPGRIAAISDGQGGRALKLDVGASNKGRAAVHRTLAPAQDFSRVRAVTLEAFYDGAGEAGLSLVFTLASTEGWVDYESAAVTLTKGWNRVDVLLDERTFRSLSEAGPFDADLPGARDRVGRVGFLLHRDSETPAVTLFRNIRLHEN